LKGGKETVKRKENIEDVGMIVGGMVVYESLTA
jgi:hypothetical protein